MTIFFNAHAWVYVQGASFISMPIMQALVKKEKTLSACARWVLGCLKNFQCPCPPGFRNGLKQIALPVWYD